MAWSMSRTLDSGNPIVPIAHRASRNDVDAFRMDF